jgi:hypothetical protein
MVSLDVSDVNKRGPMSVPIDRNRVSYVDRWLVVLSSKVLPDGLTAEVGDTAITRGIAI